jgi:hypothetical protein
VFGKTDEERTARSLSDEELMGILATPDEPLKEKICPKK